MLLMHAFIIDDYSDDIANYIDLHTIWRDQHQNIAMAIITLGAKLIIKSLLAYNIISLSDILYACEKVSGAGGVKYYKYAFPALLKTVKYSIHIGNKISQDQILALCSFKNLNESHYEYLGCVFNVIKGEIEPTAPSSFVPSGRPQGTNDHRLLRKRLLIR